MATTKGSDQAPIVTQRFLNTAAWAGDPGVQTLVTTASVSGSIVQEYTGALGGILTLGEGGADYYSDKTNGQQLYAGDYQYVQFDPLMVSPVVQGQVVFWKDNSTNLLGGKFIVTGDMTGVNLPNIGSIAGIALTNTVKANYWFIQISGIAQVKFISGTGLATLTPTVGDLVFVDYTTPSALARDPDQTTTNLSLAQWKTRLGVAFGTAPASSAISPVFLDGPKYYPGA